MVLLWFGIGIGVIIIIYLVIKYFKTPKNGYHKFKMNCVCCGDKTNRIKCIRCENK
jgi:hypothetical protein